MSKLIEPPTTLLLFLLPLLLAGCFGGGPTTTTDRPLPTQDDQQFYNLTAPQVLPSGGMEVRLEVVHGGTANVTLTDAPHDGPRGRVPTGSACGGVSFEQLEGAKKMFGDSKGWAESQGHAVLLASGGEPTAIENDQAVESLLLPVHFLNVYTLPNLTSGQIIAVRVFYHNYGGLVYSPYVNVTGLDARFRVASAQAISYACGANFEHFSGYLVQQGFSEGTIVGRELRYNLPNATSIGTRAGIFIAMVKGTCQVQVLLNGSVVKDSGVQTTLCLANYNGPPGKVAFSVPAVTGTGPFVSYGVLDEAPEP